MKYVERNQVPTRNDPWVQWARAILLLFAGAVLLASISGCTVQRDDSDPEGAISGLIPRRDALTGCEYLVASIGSGTAITSRMDRNGKQVCR